MHYDSEEGHFFAIAPCAQVFGYEDGLKELNLPDPTRMGTEQNCDEARKLVRLVLGAAVFGPAQQSVSGRLTADAGCSWPP